MPEDATEEPRDRSAPPSDTGATVELALSDPPPDGVLVEQRDLRDHLPGLEPDRRITDWGRSERVEGLVDRVVYDFLYHYWFRVESEGIDNVPEAGSALLVCNHGGALPPDGIMVAKAIRELHPRRRHVHLAVQRSFQRIPGLGMLLTKIGGVPAHPANIHRLLFDEQQLVLAFPEGRKGTDKALKERYRLRGFEPTGLISAAMRARVPIVPIAIMGAEEAEPLFGRLRLPARLPRLPLTSAVPLPAKFRIRFLEPIATDELGAKPWLERTAQAVGVEQRAEVAS